MAIENRFGSRNPLLRRVRRHANTTTLFRQAAAPSSVPGPVYTAWPVGVTPAMPVPDETILDAAIARAQQSSAAAPVQRTPYVPPVPPAAPATAVSPTIPSPPAPVSTPAPDLQRAAAPSATNPRPEPAPAPAAKDDWPEWGRLESIVRRHKARIADESESQGAAAQTPATAVSPHTASPETIARAAAAAESSTNPALPERLPLESVWPVRRDPAPPAAPSAGPDLPATERPLPTGPVLADQEEALVRAKLEDVHAGRASGSSIELHLPRRPRPDRLQRHPAPAANPQVIQQQADPAPAPTAVPAPVPPAEGIAPAADERVVETPIGPLPADMWEILGQPTPELASEPPVERPGESSGAVQRAIAAAEDAPASKLPETAVSPAASAAPSPLRPAGQRLANQEPTPSAAAPEGHPPAAPPESLPATGDSTPAPPTASAVSAVSSPQPAAAATGPVDVQRAIAAAEARHQETAVTVDTAVASSPASTASPQPQPAAPAPDSAMPEKTAVPPPPPPISTPVLVQRETGDQPAPQDGPAAAAVPAASSTPAAESVQRAVAAAKAAPEKAGAAVDTARWPPAADKGEESVLPARPVQDADRPVLVTAVEKVVAADESGDTAVVAPAAPAADGAVQRAIAAAETPPSEVTAVATHPAQPAEEKVVTSLSSPSSPGIDEAPIDHGDNAPMKQPAADLPAGERVQRAIAAAETMPSDTTAFASSQARPVEKVETAPATPSASLSGDGVPAAQDAADLPAGERVQRAIAAAE
ncbi:MAG: hypothetical protein KC441_02600, partial [Anaerolineales bacterium]|nr:hypothetical protein [Anaerolineales bacterium]